MVALKLSLAYLTVAINKANLRDGFDTNFFLRSHANYVKNIITTKNKCLYSVWFGDTQVWLNEYWKQDYCLICVTIDNDSHIYRKYRYEYELDTIYEEFHHNAIKRVINDVIAGRFPELEIRILKYLCRSTVDFPEDFKVYGAPSSP